MDVVACVEEDPAARDAIPRELGVELTHDSFDEVLETVDFDALACVDYYAKRGPTVIKALQAGKHCITDKPLCTRIEELQEVARLSREKGLIVQVDLTMRYSAASRTVQRIMRQGIIGEPVSATVFGQHPLSWGSRPGWYFEPGKHGGTINDIMIHGIDMLRWITGKEYTRVLAACASSVADSPAPDFFQQSAQCWLEMDGGLRVFGDASYLVPAGHHAPWRFFLWGSQGTLEFELGKNSLVARSGEAPVEVAVDDLPAVDPFEDFARQVEFGQEAFLSREECLQSTLAALVAQQAADTGARDLPVGTI